MLPLQKQVENLSAVSRERAIDAYSYLDWTSTPVAPESAWYTSPELITLYGTPVWDALDEPQRRRLSFYEAVNFYSLNIHGERALLEGLAARLHLPRSARYSAYLHHFLDEENKHSVIFAAFCERFAGKIYPDRKLFRSTLTETDAYLDVLFFAKAYLFETIADVFNVAMGQDDRLHPFARTINRYHHMEEARHLAFGRTLLRELCTEHSASWGTEKCASLTRYLLDYVHATWLEYYNPDAYADALGDPRLPSSWDLRDMAWENPHSAAFRATVMQRCRDAVEDFGLGSCPPGDV